MQNACVSCSGWDWRVDTLFYSEWHFVSDDSDIEALDDLSDDADSSVLVDSELQYFIVVLSSKVWIVVLLLTSVPHRRLFPTVVCKWTVEHYFISVTSLLESRWNVISHGDAREGKWRENWRMEWVASSLNTTSEHGVSSIDTTDAHTSAASSRLNWRPRWFKWTPRFRQKTKSGFCACAITFQRQSTNNAFKDRLDKTWQPNTSSESLFSSDNQDGPWCSRHYTRQWISLYDMAVYLVKEFLNAASNITPTNGILL